MTEKLLRVGIWATVSSEKQAAEDKHSLEYLQKFGQRLAAAVNGKVVAQP